MKPEDVPQELIDILDERAGKTHSRTGSVVACLAEIITRLDEIRGRDGQKKRWADMTPEEKSEFGRRRANRRWHPD